VCWKIPIKLIHLIYTINESLGNFNKLAETVQRNAVEGIQNGNLTWEQGLESKKRHLKIMPQIVFYLGFNSLGLPWVNNSPKVSRVIIF